MTMKKIPFNQLPIYKAIRGCKLSRRTQNEVLRKLKKYSTSKKEDILFDGDARDLFWALNWCVTKEGDHYWSIMHRDSGL